MDLAAFADEMSKIAGIDLTGLSPKTLLSTRQAEPFEGEGLKKAKAVLDLAKTASKRVKGDATRSAIGHTIAGASAGRVIAELSHNVPSQMKRSSLTAAGAAVGLGDWAFRERQLKKAKELKDLKAKTAAPTPQGALQSAQKVGRFSHVTTTNMMGKPGPTMQSLAPTLGRKGVLPTEHP